MFKLSFQNASFVGLFTSFSMKPNSPTHSCREATIWESDWGKQSFTVVCCKPCLDNIQCSIHLSQWYDQKILMPLQLYHITLSACRLGTGYPKPVIVEPLVRRTQIFGAWLKCRVGTDSIYFNHLTVGLYTPNHSPILSHLAAFECFRAAMVVICFSICALAYPYLPQGFIFFMQAASYILQAGGI